MALAEYIWLDGAVPTQALRAKTRFLPLSAALPAPGDLPYWSFDGSSTGQAEGFDSDCGLVPVAVMPDPLRSPGDILVLCEVSDGDGRSHRSNTRAGLRTVLAAGAALRDAWIGFEQEYALTQDGRPLGFPDQGLPPPQGPYYCSVGSDRAFGRQIAEEHARLCIDAGLMYYGLNAEVMPGQWEFQIGYRGLAEEDAGLLNTADHLWIARYLLHRVAERHGVIASLANKPVAGDWNGSGMHTNFSCAATRAPDGMAAIHKAERLLAHAHEAHIAVYGDGLEQRLTGLHETCSISEFKAGGADRGASIRIPQDVEGKGRGYFEDRRPGANADPYLVAARLAATVFEIDIEAATGMALVA